MLKNLGVVLPTNVLGNMQIDLNPSVDLVMPVNWISFFSNIVWESLGNTDLGSYLWTKQLWEKCRLPEEKLQHSVETNKNFWTLWSR